MTDMTETNYGIDDKGILAEVHEMAEACEQAIDNLVDSLAELLLIYEKNNENKTTLNAVAAHIARLEKVQKLVSQMYPDHVEA